MSAKKSSAIPIDKLALYQQLLAAHPDIELKGKTLPYTSLNGHMFSFLSGDGTLAIRLPEEERVLFLKKYNTCLMEAHGTIMKEYAVVPDYLLGQRDELAAYLNISYEYVKTLKPKPTTADRKKKKG